MTNVTSATDDSLPTVSGEQQKIKVNLAYVLGGPVISSQFR